VTQAQKAYDISFTRYNAGAGTILELNSAQLALTQAKLSYSQSIYDYLAAYAEYEKALGKDSIE
jgi:outer membrane protein TolC